MKIFNICVLWNIICHFLQDSTLSFKAEFLRLEKSTKKHNNCLSKFRADSKKWIYRKRIKITRSDEGIFLSEKEIINKLEDLLDIKISAKRKNNLYKILRTFLKRLLRIYWIICQFKMMWSNIWKRLSHLMLSKKLQIL